LVYVPASLNAKTPSALVLALHGATQDSRVMTTPLAPLAESIGCPIIAPDSRAVTWDGIRGDFGVDVEFIDKALAWAFDHCLVDPKRIWLAGFSDGASYGLGLGLSNGDLFSRILAFSPGFIPQIDPSKEKPRIFVSHGTEDQILPIDQTSRPLVPMLKRAGYDVEYKEFAGRHGYPPPIVTAATAWLKSG
jgi:phospholipase/carboxylesterase